MTEVLITQTQNSSVYKYFDTNRKIYVAKKVLKTTNRDKMYRYLRETAILQKFTDDEHCIKYLESKTYEEQKYFIYEIYTEYCEGGNLKNYINELREKKQSIGIKIYEYISIFVNFFENMQRNGISHRDIKPENIFITREGKMKIGDFGCSISTFGVEDFTIQGSPYFLSPELRLGYQEYINKKGGCKIKHCPYKSDVFSLGLVFLCLASNENLNDDFSGIEKLKNAINYRFSKLTDPVIHQIITLMLEINSHERPDFIQLKQKIEISFQYRCLVCRSGVTIEEPFCPDCMIYQHRSCLSSSACPKCVQKLKFYCNSCSLPFIKESRCSHQICEFCTSDSLSCSKCPAFGFLEPSHSIKVDHREWIPCPEDGEICHISGNFYTCSSCDQNFCLICKKNMQNHENCLNSQVLRLTCRCSASIQVSQIDSLFYTCPKCGFRCVVCMKSLNHEHSSCALLFNKSINSN